MRLESDDFELFDLPRRFALESQAVDARWRALQSEVHPDRFVAQGSAAQRLAMQWAVRVNEAHRRLRDPLQRAAYLCELAGVPIDAERNTAMPVEFLKHQLAWREALDDSGTAEELHQLAEEVRAFRTNALQAIEVAIDAQNDTAAAAQHVRALMFVERFAHDIDRRLEAFET